MTAAEENIPSPNAYTFSQRVALFNEHKDMYAELFELEAAARTGRIALQAELLTVVGEYELFDRFDTEQVHFDTIVLEMNDDPSFYMIDYFMRPIIGPRLELHLHGAAGVHTAKEQLKRIARYIEARNLEREYPNISATTFTPLAKVAHRVTQMPPAIMMYIPESEDDDVSDRFEGAFESHNTFLKRHRKAPIDPEDARFSGLVLSTEAFLRVWNAKGDTS